jgi:hypothetical protein
MKFGIKLLLMTVLTAPISWLIATVWQTHGTWWVQARPAYLEEVILRISGSLLPADIALAEDRLEFLTFWVPVVLFLLIIVLAYCLLKKKDL